MTRKELETEIIKKLWEIQDMIEKFDASILRTNLTCAPGHVDVFALRHDEKGEPITGDYHFSATEFKREE